MQMKDFSFEGCLSDEGNLTALNSLANYIQKYECGKPWQSRARNIALIALPLENREVYILDKRPGCDMAAHVISQRLSTSPLTIEAAVAARVAVLSSLSHYETQPLRIQRAERESFYERELVGEVLGVVAPSPIAFLSIAGSVDFALRQMASTAAATGAKPVLLKLSPLVYAEHLPTEMSVVHIGLDRKFIGGKRPSESVEYDCSRGIGESLECVRRAAAAESLFVLLDCQLLSSDYFPGISVPFPFSLSKADFLELWKEICALSPKIAALTICHFNPTVEERISVAFLIEVIHRFICSF